MEKMNLLALREGPLLLVALALFVGPTVDFSDHLGWYDQQRLVQIALLIGAAVGLITVWREPAVAFFLSLPRWVVMAFVGGGSAGLLSLLNAEYPRFAALEWATFFLLMWLVMLIARQASASGASFDLWAHRLVVTLAVVIGLKVMVGYVALLTQGRLETIRLFEGVFSNRRFFGQVASMVIPLLAYPLLRGGRSRKAQAALFALLAVWWMFVIASGTRGTWLALLLAAGVLSVFAWRACAGWVRIQVGALGAGVALFGVLFVWLPTWLGAVALIENRTSDIATLNGRAELWAMAWSQIQAHPWLGVGPMQLAAIPMKFGAHPHNSVLQLAAEWGVPAACALLLPAFIGVCRLLMKLREDASPDVLLLCLAASLLAVGAQSLVDGVIVVPYTQTCVALLAGWALGFYYRGGTEAVISVAARTTRLGIPALTMLALVALLNGVVPEAFNRVEVTQAFVNAGNAYIPPRYWGVGQIP